MEVPSETRFVDESVKKAFYKLREGDNIEK